MSIFLRKMLKAKGSYRLCISEKLPDNSKKRRGYG